MTFPGSLSWEIHKISGLATEKQNSNQTGSDFKI